MSGWWRRLGARRRPEQGGFAFIEVIVASSVLFIAVFAVGSQLGTQFLSIATSDVQQGAAGLLNQAMEEVRALPYTFVATGLSLSDSTVATDPDLLVSGQTCKTNNSAIWPTQEVVPCAAPGNEAQAPFVPHISQTTEDGITFSTAAYPSIDAADTGSGPKIYRVTIVVTWNTHQPGPKQIVAQTLVYSAATGCLAQNNHPFAAPCQPFLYAGTAAGGGYINVTPQSGATGSAIEGDPFDSVELLLAAASAAAEIEQVSTVLGSVQTSGGSVSSGGVLTGSGDARAAASADNDPGTSRNLSSPPANGAPIAVSNSSPGATQATGSGSYANSISVQPGSSDSGATVATAVANTNPACTDIAGSTQTTNLPCGNAEVSQNGASATLLMSLFAGTVSLGSTPLATAASQSSSYPDVGFVGRYTTSGAGYCTQTSGDGCVHAAAQESLGTLELAGLPAQVIADNAAPASWGAGSAVCPAGNYLLAVVGFSASVTSESGIGAASPSANVPVPGAPTPYLCYWSSSGYVGVPMTWGVNVPSVTLPTVSVTDSAVSSGAVTVSITPTIQLQATSVSTKVNPNCVSVCTASASVPSPIEGDISYVVQQGPTVLASLDEHVQLGDLVANTSYQEAPSP